MESIKVRSYLPDITELAVDDSVIYYHNGVGSSGSFVDTITGGLLGTGISENIREVNTRLSDGAPQINL